MRKPAGSETTSRRNRLPLPDVRRRIWEQACDLVADGEKRDLSAVIAKRFDIPESTICLVLTLEGMRHERTAAALRNGVLNALAIASEAGHGVNDDISDVA